MLRRCESILTACPPAILALLSLSVGAVKAGVVLFTPTIWDLRSFPAPIDAYPYLSYGYRSVAKLLGLDSVIEYRWMFFVSIVVIAIGIGAAFRTVLPADQRSWPVLLLMSGPTAWVIAGGFGRVDPIVLAGGILLGLLGRKSLWAVVSILLASLGNPETAIVIALTVVVISLDQRFRDRRRGALFALVASVVYFGGVRIWSLALGVPSRDSVFLEILPRSFQAFFYQWPLLIWATYGLAAFAVFTLSISRSRISIPWVFGAIALPLLPSVLSADQSRVNVACASAIVVIALIEVTPRALTAIRKVSASPLLITLGVILVLPAIEVQFLTVRSPWQEGWRFFYFYVLSTMGFNIE